MRSDIPKQFLPLAGKPLLSYSLEAFHAVDSTIQILLVLPARHIAYWHQFLNEQAFAMSHTVIEGGETRYQSVKNGLLHCQSADLIAIHDGARPLVSTNLIRRLIRHAAKHGNAIPAIPVPESLRKITTQGNHPVPREDYRLIQTPQVFNAPQLQQAYLQPYKPQFTDDATVFETLGEPIHLVEGDPVNIKLTYPTDLLLAESLLLHS